MTKMIDFEKIYDSFTDELAGNQKRLDVNTVLGVYYGVSSDGYLRLSFLSSVPTPKLESTKLLKVYQGRESDNVYWTCFDLLQPEAKKVYFAFCATLIDAVKEIKDETEAISKLKKRYLTWKTMFKKELSQSLSREVIQGLFGELYFLKNYLARQYSISECVKAWSGPDSTSKDYSMGNTWYEIKTIGANNLKVRISSLSQLSSSVNGHLVILKVEKMAPAFTNGESSIEELFKSILNLIDDEAIEGLFLSKLSSFGADISDESFSTKFDVKDVSLYKVDESFPKIKEEDIKYDEVCEVGYSLIVNSLKKFLEE